MAARAAWLGAALLVLVCCLVAYVPFAPGLPSAGLDSDWVYALNAAVVQRLVFGQDIVFTFGPYASVYTTGYHPGTDAMISSADLILAIGVAGGLLTLAPGRLVWLALGVAFSTSLLAQVPVPRDGLMFVLPLLLLAVVARTMATRGRVGAEALVSGALLVVGLAVIVLVKGTLASTAAVSLGMSVLLLLAYRRWRLALGGATLFVVAVAAFWVIARQPLWALPNYFIAQLPIVSGYTDAMSLEGPAWQTIGFVAAVALILASNYRACRSWGIPGLALLAGFAVMVEIVFKAGFVRQDGHIMLAASALALMAGVLALADRGRAAVLGFVIGLLAWGVSESLSYDFGPLDGLLHAEQLYQDAGRGLLDRLQGSPALHAGYAQFMQQIRTALPLPALAGTTDTYSSGQSALLANGLTWSPRPVLQSYSAYTPSLARKNADHLNGAGAPDNIIIALQPIDGRLPALEDALSWPALLTRYQPVGMQRDAAILRRVPGAGSAPGLIAIRPGTRRRLGEKVLLAPSTAPLWAEIDLKQTTLGRVMSAIFKLPDVHIVLTLQDGSVRSFRFIPGMGRSPFMISPLVLDARRLLALQGTDTAADRVVSFEIDGAKRFWRPGYDLKLFGLPLPALP